MPDFNCIGEARRGEARSCARSTVVGIPTSEHILGAHSGRLLDRSERLNMGCGGKKKDPKEKKDGDDDDGGKCVVDPKMMKLITLITLLVSDADVIFTSERTTFLSQPIGHELV